MFKIRTQRRGAPFWLVELLDFLDIELKNAIALDLLSRSENEDHTARMSANEEKQRTIDAPESFRVSVHPRL